MTTCSGYCFEHKKGADTSCLDTSRQGDQTVWTGRLSVLQSGRQLTLHVQSPGFNPQHGKNICMYFCIYVFIACVCMCVCVSVCKADNVMVPNGQQAG